MAPTIVPAFAVAAFLIVRKLVVEASTAVFHSKLSEDELFWFRSLDDLKVSLAGQEGQTLSYQL
ncbi:MAG: hypothetical protein H0W86_03350 [Armatimonadetes bacterium]|nr:hypothetical protein [Armatimonadota bacterium]